MKMQKLKLPQLSALDCGCFQKGVDTSSCAAKIDDNAFKSAKNLWFKGGLQKTRPALCADDNPPHPKVAYCRMTVTDTVYRITGTDYKFGYYSQKISNTEEILRIFLIDAQGNTLDCGYLRFTAQSGTFYIPASVVFLIGTPLDDTKTGVYAVVRTRYVGIDRSNIYEMAANHQSWSEVSERDRYVPTVLTNARGNLYYTTEEGMQTPEKRIYPEKSNMISPYFKCFFTSDGFSWRFDLPANGISSDDVECRVYTGDGGYTEFIIEGDDGTRGTIGGVEYTVYCNRSSGYVFFMSDGVARGVPNADLANNIEIVAACRNNYNPEKVLSGQYAISYDSRYYIFGNNVTQNEGYACLVENPLYFPADGKITVGKSNEAVKGIGTQNDKLIVFKARETYKVGIYSNGNAVDLENTIGTDSRYYIADRTVAQTVSTVIGCKKADTVAYISGRLIWLGSDNKVYTLETTTYGSEKNIFSISSPIQKELDEALAVTENLFSVSAFVKDGYYFLCVGNKMFVCDCLIREYGFPERYANFHSKSALAWHIWEFPKDIEIHGVNIDNNTLLVCTDVSEDYQYVATFSDAPCDTLYVADSEGWFEKKDYKIGSYFYTKDFDFGQPYALKSVNSVLITAGENCTFDFEAASEKYRIKRHFHGVKQHETVKILLPAQPVKTLNIKISGQNKMSIGNFLITYKAVS